MARSGSTPCRSVAPVLDRCRAASRATRLAPELESWTTPPPGPSERNDAGRAEEVGEPVQDVLLELGGSRAGHPGHALDAEARGDQVAEHGRPGGVGGEVAEEAGVLPVRDAGQHDPVEVGEDGGERLALLGRGAGQGRADLAGGDLRAHRQRVDPGPVVGDPVDDLVAVLAELLGSHVRNWLGHRRHRIGATSGPRRGPRGAPDADEDAGKRVAPRGGARRGARRLPRRPPRLGSTRQGNGTWPRCGPEDRNVMAAVRSGGSRSSTVPPVRLERTLRGF